MKVYANIKWESRGIERIVIAIKKYAPSNIEFIDNIKGSNLVILYINGRRDGFTRLTDLLLSQGKQVIMVQVSLRSTQKPSTSDWIPLWKRAKLVWSYYDLEKHCKEDGNKLDFNFYHAPLGVTKEFKRYKVEKEYLIATSGVGFTGESVRECVLAAEALGKRVFHVGPEVTNRKSIDFSHGMNDTELAKKYSSCQFVSGLRRKDGFEMPILEGFVCGARPIVFDTPNYRQWFSDIAAFIPENDPESVKLNLIEIFKKVTDPISDEEINKVRKRFDWEKIIAGFWKRALSKTS